MVAVFQDHRVQLEPPKTGGLGGPDAAQHPIQLAGPGDAAETLRLQAVQADVEPRHAGRLEVRRQSLQLRAVGGQHQFRQPTLAQPAQFLK